MKVLTLLSILFPFLAGFSLLFWNPCEKRRNQFVLTVVLTNSLLLLSIIYCLLHYGSDALCITLFSLGKSLPLCFRPDRLSIVFAFILALLWPPAAVYSFSYMEHKDSEHRFFAFFTMSYGIASGVAFSGSFFTLYLFCELLTLTTLPLAMHYMDEAAHSLSRKYLLHSLLGAALAFPALLYLANYASPFFRFGGSLLADHAVGYEAALLVVYVLAFFGFGTKASIFPLHSWLPASSVAPAPATALLHAIAVVKAGVFALIRLTHYCFGTELLAGTMAQSIIMGFAGFTAFYGAFRAISCPHFKRRLAYLSVSSMGYLLFSVSLLRQDALVGGLSYMLNHALIKVTLTFCAGAIIHCTGKEYVRELEGLGKSMPVISFSFVLAALGLMSIPPLGCFAGKWTVACAAISCGNPVAYAGAAFMALSTAFTVIALCDIMLPMFFPLKGVDLSVSFRHVPDWRLRIPPLVLTLAGLLLAFSSRWLLDVLSLIGLSI